MHRIILDYNAIIVILAKVSIRGPKILLNTSVCALFPLMLSFVYKRHTKWQIFICIERRDIVHSVDKTFVQLG